MQATLDTGSDVPAGELQGKMQRLSHRDLQLWLMALLVLLVVAAGVVALVLPNLSWNNANLRVEMRYLPQVLFGLIGIVILFNLYVLQQRGELNQAREALVQQLMERQKDESTVLIDPLTHLFNRRYLDYVLPKELYRAKRRGGSLTLLLVGVEGLRALVTSQGARVGDECLLEVARLMEATFRRSDTVLRYDNSQYMVLLPDTLKDQAEIAMARLLREIELRNEKSDAPCKIGLSWGVSVCEDGTDLGDLLRAAEQSLREEKKRKRTDQVLRSEACPKLLLVSSDAGILGMLRPILDTLGIGVELCPRADETIGAIGGRKLDAVLLDCGAQDENLEVLGRIRQTPRGRRLLALAIVSAGGTEAAQRLGANFVLNRPLNVEVVTRSLRVAYGLMVGEEQRFFRHAVRTTVHLNFGESLIEATATHLSEGGMVVQTPVPLELHRTGTLRFKLPDLPSPLEAQGEMAWAGDGQHAGIRFVHMPMASRHLLKRWLAERASREIEAKPSGNTVGGGPRGLAPVAISAVALSAAS